MDSARQLNRKEKVHLDWHLGEAVMEAQFNGDVQLQN